MTLTEIKTMLESISGFSTKVAYAFFPEGQAPSLPFICYLETSSNNFGADGIVYHERMEVQIEFYSKQRDTSNESLIENKLKENGIFWNKDFTYLEDEKCYMTVYKIEV